MKQPDFAGAARALQAYQNYRSRPGIVTELNENLASLARVLRLLNEWERNPALAAISPVNDLRRAVDGDSPAVSS